MHLGDFDFQTVFSGEKQCVFEPIKQGDEVLATKYYFDIIFFFSYPKTKLYVYESDEIDSVVRHRGLHKKVSLNQPKISIH